MNSSRRWGRAPSASRRARTMPEPAHWSRRSMMPTLGWRLPAERAFLAVLDGSCRTPIGGHAKFEQRNAALPRHHHQAGWQRSIRGFAAKARARLRPSLAPTPAANCARAPAPTSLFAGLSHAASGHTARAGRGAHRGGVARARSHRSGRAAAAHRTGGARRQSVLDHSWLFWSLARMPRRQSLVMSASRNCGRCRYSRLAIVAQRRCARRALPM